MLKVELVSPEKKVWSGEAVSISARTLDGDLGILTDHTPLLGVLVDGEVVIKGSDGSTNTFNVAGGFLSVSQNRVSILAEATN